MLIELLSWDRIKTGVVVSSWEELVDEVGSIMIAAGDVQPSYVGAMKDVVREIGTYCVIAPGVVLLHARPEDGVNEISIALVKLDEGVNFGSINDPVFLAFGFGAVDHDSHLTLLTQVAQLLQDKNNINQLIEAKDRQTILEIVSSVQ